MSGSKYEYVRTYERPDALLANTFLLLRIDGHAFHKYVVARRKASCSETIVCSSRA